MGQVDRTAHGPPVINGALTESIAGDDRSPMDEPSAAPPDLTITAAELAQLEDNPGYVLIRPMVVSAIIPRRTIRPDSGFVGKPGNVARVGQSIGCTLNRQGAVVAVTGVDGGLGIKPREFDFVCPYATGVTYLDDDGWHIDVDAGHYLWTEAGAPWHIERVGLVRIDQGWCWVISVEPFTYPAKLGSIVPEET